jgi:hypothetical protein
VVPNLRSSVFVAFNKNSTQTKISQTNCTVGGCEYYTHDNRKMSMARRRETGVFTVLWFQIPMEHNGLRLEQGMTIRESRDQLLQRDPVHPAQVPLS